MSTSFCKLVFIFQNDFPLRAEIVDVVTDPGVVVAAIAGSVVFALVIEDDTSQLNGEVAGLLGECRLFR